MITGVVTTREQFNKLQPHWEALIAQARCPELFDTWEWSAACLDSVHAGDERLFIITVQDGERYAGIAPFRLVNRKIGGVSVRTLQFIHYGLAVYGNLYLDQRYGVRTILNHVINELKQQRRKWDYIEMLNLNSSQQIVYMAHYMFHEAFSAKLVDSELSSSIQFKSYSEELLNRKEIRNIESRQKKLFKQFEARIVIDECYKPSHWERMVELYSDKWGGMDPEFRSFCETLFPLLDNKGRIGFSYIEINGRIEAINVTQRMNNKIYGQLTNYSVEYAKWGLSVMLIHNMVEHFRQEGIEELDFLHGVQPYKFNWTNSWCRNSHLFIFNSNATGIYLSFYMWIKMILKESTTLPKLLTRLKNIRKRSSLKGQRARDKENGELVKLPQIETVGG